MTVDVDDLWDGLWIAAFDSELYAEDRAVETPKIRFSANKILTGRFLDSSSDDILDHHSKLPFM